LTAIKYLKPIRTKKERTLPTAPQFVPGAEELRAGQFDDFGKRHHFTEESPSESGENKDENVNLGKRKSPTSWVRLVRVRRLHITNIAIHAGGITLRSRKKKVPLSVEVAAIRGTESQERVKMLKKSATDARTRNIQRNTSRGKGQKAGGGQTYGAHDFLDDSGATAERKIALGEGCDFENRGNFRGLVGVPFLPAGL